MTEEEIAAQAAVTAEAEEKARKAFSQAAGSIIEKTPEQIAAEAAALAGGEIKTPEQIAAAKLAAAGGEDVKFVRSPYWDAFGEKHGIKLPEVLNVEKLDEGVNEQDLMFQTITTHALNSLPQEVRDLYTHISENKLVDDFYKAKVGESGYLTLPDDQYAKERLRRLQGKSESNPDGLSAEDIEEKVQKLANSGALEFLAEDWRVADKAQLSKGKSQEEISAAQEAQFTAGVESVTSSVKEFYDKQLPEVKSIGGIDVSQEELNAFKPLYERLVTPDPVLGGAPIAMIMRDDALLFNMLYSSFRSKDSIAKLLSNAKEDAKNGILKSLDIEPITQSSQTEETSINVKLSNFASADRGGH